MDPAMREQWGEAWSHWLKPSGTLVTLMFPMEPEGREGPPWPVSTELYHKHLDPHGKPHPHLQLESLSAFKFVLMKHLIDEKI